MSAEEIGSTSARIRAGEKAGEKLLTLRDLCARLQCSRTTAWRLINERGLRAVKCGGLVRVRESDLAAWIEKHCAGSGTEGSASQ
jgi:excisionase family DNA binding protein